MKLLKDYPQNEWMDAADGCEYCGAKYEVQITSLEDKGCFGGVVTRIRHKEDCPERYDIETGFDRGEDFSHDVAGWTFKKKIIEITGKKFSPLATRSNIGPCLNCEKLVIGCPLILFVDEGRGGELDFCFSCAEKLGILDHLK